MASILEMCATSAAHPHPGRALRALNWVTTAAALTGVPSLKLMPGRNVNVHDLRSAEFDHLLARRTGAGRPLLSKPTIGS